MFVNTLIGIALVLVVAGVAFAVKGMWIALAVDAGVMVLYALIVWLMLNSLSGPQ